MKHLDILHNKQKFQLLHTHYKIFPINILSDSQYSVHVTIYIETTTIKDTIPFILYTLFTNLQKVIRYQQSPFYITHTPAHTDLLGPLTEFSSPKKNHFFLKKDLEGRQKGGNRRMKRWQTSSPESPGTTTFSD